MFQAREEQLPPLGDWTVWLILGGRGAGKTRAGAEWVKGLALGKSGFAPAPVGRIALVGETLIDARAVMVEGVSGLLAVHDKDERPTWQPSRRRLEWKNGAVAELYSAEDPESLRGPQFAAAWADELAKWRQAEAAWDMLQFALRLGDRPRQAVTTTPRPIPLLARLMEAPATAVARMPTRDNAGNLAPGFLEAVVGRYRGTRLGRQELDGEILADREDALWNRDAVERARVDQAPALARIVVAVDPPASGGRTSVCGIVAAGLGADGLGYVVADDTVSAAAPDVWAARAVATYRRLEADALIAEINQGGDMVAAVIRQVDSTVPVRSVRASRGKWLRAEPVATLYAQGRVRHAGAFPKLEDELCGFGPDGTSGGRSPDRLDALVWALTELMLSPGGRPAIRRF
ncbi:DNA-packaging protein [Amorphus sp. 3PC139-8]|uniref:DNA-packaging protein n=1 Tax=Amorphus sp. 3PC139-8 TaxID=2735676 RepID=UPI00345D6356